MNKAVVSIAVDGRIDVKINITPEMSKKDIRRLALEAFQDADLSKMEVVGTQAINLTAENLEFDF